LTDFTAASNIDFKFTHNGVGIKDRWTDRYTDLKKTKKIKAENTL